jgi:hypothetical protein
MKRGLLRSSADHFRPDLIERKNFLGEAGTRDKTGRSCRLELLLIR